MRDQESENSKIAAKCKNFGNRFSSPLKSRKSEIGNQKSDFVPRPPIENVGIGCGQLDIWGGRGGGGQFFSAWFFFEPNTLPDIFFANINLHDLFLW